jgi:hypothetical protein
MFVPSFEQNINDTHKRAIKKTFINCASLMFPLLLYCCSLARSALGSCKKELSRIRSSRSAKRTSLATTSQKRSQSTEWLLDGVVGNMSSSSCRWWLSSQNNPTWTSIAGCLFCYLADAPKLIGKQHQRLSQNLHWKKDVCTILEKFLMIK